MYIVEIVLLLAGTILLVTGYRRNNRNLMLSAAITLLLAGTLGDAIRGYIDGYRQGSGIATSTH